LLNEEAYRVEDSDCMGNFSVDSSILAEHYMGKHLLLIRIGN
jgi:hypothetical protein